MNDGPDLLDDVTAFNKEHGFDETYSENEQMLEYE